MVALWMVHVCKNGHQVMLNVFGLSYYHLII